MVNVNILVFSDSHSGMSFMRYCMDTLRPDHVIHLGDHYEDGEALSREYPQARFHQVMGNCDAYRWDLSAPKVMHYDIGGVRFYMTHGHLHGVKSDDSSLISAARKTGAAIALYGHTHIPRCDRLTDGLWVMNPGSCRSYGGSVGLVCLEDKKVSSCRILQQEDMVLTRSQAEKE